ncbi:MAG: FAD-dependent oxidoreductase [Magnetococcales bacterium]|nr:FAD-dependent oxidoreductase [Magnetococcales bacterium]
MSATADNPQAAILILGAGVAGLSAALHLADAGLQPLVLEAALAPGGRARSRFDPRCQEELDNGPHLLMGAYTHTLHLLSRLGTRHQLLAAATPAFTFWDRTQGWHTLTCPDWPAPWHLLAGLARFAPLSWRDGLTALRLAPALLADLAPLEQLSVTHWLARQGQGDNICQRLWYPLCLTTLNEPPASANAALFAAVLKRLFLSNRQAATPLLPAVPLSQLLITPAVTAIQQAGGAVRCRCRVQRLIFSGSHLECVQTEQGHWQRPRAVIAALPPAALVRLLPAWAEERQITTLRSAPIVSVHLTYAQPATLPTALVGLPQETSQWLLDRNRAQGMAAHPSNGRFSAVLSGAYRERTWPAARLIAAVHADLGRLLPALAARPPAMARVIKEHQATFAAWPGTSACRPASQTPWDNLWLAGDWTATGLPATLEGAIWSGMQAAQKILDLLAHGR